MNALSTRLVKGQKMKSGGVSQVVVPLTKPSAGPSIKHTVELGKKPPATIPSKTTHVEQKKQQASLGFLNKQKPSPKKNKVRFDQTERAK